MGGQEIGLRLAEVHPGSSAQTTPNGSYLNDGSTLERENEDLKVKTQLRTVTTIVIAHTFCASPDTRIS